MTVQSPQLREAASSSARSGSGFNSQSEFTRSEENSADIGAADSSFEPYATASQRGNKRQKRNDMSAMAGFHQDEFDNTHDALLDDNYRENTFEGKRSGNKRLNDNDCLLPSIQR